MAQQRRPHRKKMRPARFAELRLTVYTRDGFACRHCGWSPPVPADYDGRGALGIYEHRPATRGETRPRAVFRALQLDHVILYSKGGATTLDNLQALCTPCNNRKGAKH